MSFQEADYFNAINGNQFIADLMPKHPVYVAMLSKTARSAIGLPHPSGRAAMRMLEREGFAYTGYVDIFDGGPTMVAETDRVTSVAAACEARVTDTELERGEKAILARGTLADFRACYGARVIEDGALAIDARAADLLGVSAQERGLERRTLIAVCANAFRYSPKIGPASLARMPTTWVQTATFCRNCAGSILSSVSSGVVMQVEITGAVLLQIDQRAALVAHDVEVRAAGRRQPAVGDAEPRDRGRQPGVEGRVWFRESSSPAARCDRRRNRIRAQRRSARPDALRNKRGCPTVRFLRRPPSAGGSFAAPSRSPSTFFAAAAMMPHPAPSSNAPGAFHQLSRWHASSTGGSDGSRPTISAATLPLGCTPRSRGVSTSRRVIGRPSARANMRSRFSASGTVSAPAGVGATPSGNEVPPVCGLRVIVGANRLDYGRHRALARRDPGANPTRRPGETVMRAVHARPHLVADIGYLARQRPIGRSVERGGVLERDDFRLDPLRPGRGRAAERRYHQRLGERRGDISFMAVARHPGRMVERFVGDVGEAVARQPVHRPAPPTCLGLGARLPRTDLGGDPLDEVPGELVLVQRAVGRIGQRIGEDGRGRNEEGGGKERADHAGRAIAPALPCRAVRRTPPRCPS